MPAHVHHLEDRGSALGWCEKACPQRVSIEAAAFNMTKSTDERPFTPTSGQNPRRFPTHVIA